MSAEQPSSAAAWIERHCHFAGFDWGKQQHVVVVVDRAGTVVAELQFAEDADGWRRFAERIASMSDLAVTVETSSGPVVERLLELGCEIYPVNPKSAKDYRTRKSPAGVKDDRFDAWTLGDALRTDGHGWRRLHPDDPITCELRMLCRDEIGLIGQRTALVNQLQSTLAEYYRSALDAFDDWTMQAAWEFVERFPTPEELRRKGRRQWEKFLHAHRLARPETYEKRLAIFARVSGREGSEAATRAKSCLALALCAQLRLVEAQLRSYRKRIDELFAKHPDSDIFGSLPGAAAKLAPRLLGECGDRRDRFDSPEALQCIAGTAPVTRRSGSMRFVKQRCACNKVLKATMHLFANCSRASCAWAQAYYRSKREQGKTHACALRCLAQRWLKIIWKMWQTRQPYDEAMHTRNQVRRGSWVVAPPASAR